MTHEDGEETVRTGAPGRRKITAKFLRQKVTWHDREMSRTMWLEKGSWGVDRICRGGRK